MEIKPKRPRLSSPSIDNQSAAASADVTVSNRASENNHLKEKGQSSSGSYNVEEQPLPGSKEVKEQPSPMSLEVEGKTKMDNNATGLLGLAYGSSDDDEEEE